MFFLGQEAATGELTMQLSEFIGPEIANSISEIIVQVNISEEGTLQTIFGVGTLVFFLPPLFL